MVVWHINTGLTGGANHAAIHLHRALGEAGIDSRFLHVDGQINDATFVKCEAPARHLERLASAVHKRLEAYVLRTHSATPRPGYFFMPIQPSRAAPPVGLPRPDIIHLQWVQNWLDFPRWPDWLPHDVPIVWTLHDAYPFTGGCIFPWGCDRHRTQCGSCPQLARSGPRDLAHREHRRKLAGIQAWPNLHVAAPSQWLAQLARESSVFARSRTQTHIPYGLAATGYRPHPTALARQVLNIPPDDFVLCFGAASGWTDPRKGYHLLRTALGQLAAGGMDGLHLLTFGPSGPPTLPAGVANTHAGSIENRQLMALVYSAADAVVVPSLQDNSPLVVLEAMSCGVPVVAFPAGGISETVREGVTGLLAADFNAEALAARLRDLRSTPGLRARLAEGARQVFLAEHTARLCAERYTALYRAALATSPSA